MWEERIVKITHKEYGLRDLNNEFNSLMTTSNGFDSDASLWISTKATPDGQVFRVEKLVPGPIWSMYGILTYIYHTSQLNVGKYTFSSHGSVIGETYGAELSVIYWAGVQ